MVKFPKLFEKKNLILLISNTIRLEFELDSETGSKREWFRIAYEMKFKLEFEFMV